MKRSMTLAFLLAACGGGGGDLTPEAGCNEAAVALCERMFACLPPAALEASGFGTTADACAAAMKQRNRCASQTTASTCAGGGTFHADQANACIDELGGLTCSQLMGGLDVNAGAPACAKVCTP